MCGLISGHKEYGDYQTPVWFCEQVLGYVQKHVTAHPAFVLEPTCGIGNFLRVGKAAFPNTPLYGLEINGNYAEEAAGVVDGGGNVYHHDFFSFDFSVFRERIPVGGTALIIGNPPWANNSALSPAGSSNLPQKSNFKGMRGLDALTGSANFDICEYIILQLIRQFQDTNTTIAMLCKTIVARNVFMEIIRNNVNCRFARVLTVDTKKVFHISADGCLLILGLSEGYARPAACEVFSFDSPDKMESQFGYRDGKLYSRLENNYVDIDGECCFAWRQGVKHDCSKVMELTSEAGLLYNGRGELAAVENALLYPLVKSSHLKKPLISAYKKSVLVTQRYVGQETGSIERAYPLTWAYLSAHEEDFNNRKSIIYKNSPRYSMFGIGEYAFAPYKVGISGFYKQPLFSLLYGEKPVMMDDTCYFISFDHYDDAYTAMIILNTEAVTSFLKNISFADAKRPFTKKVLSRVDFHKCLLQLGLAELRKTEAKLCLPAYINAAKLAHFDKLVHQNEEKESLAI